MNIPTRLDYYHYCIETWQSICKSLNFSKESTVLDICPGWSPKIEIALFLCSFQGSIIAVDQDKQSVELFQHMINLFPYQFTLKTSNQNIFTFYKKTNLQFDFLVGNHVLDDILMSLISTSACSLSLEETLYDQLWNRLANDSDQVSNAVRTIETFIFHVLKPHGILLLSQYPSYQDKLLKKSIPSKICSSILTQIQNDLIKQYNFKLYQPALNTLNIKKNTYFSANEFIALQKS